MLTIFSSFTKLNHLPLVHSHFFIRVPSWTEVKFQLHIHILNVFDLYNYDDLYDLWGRAVQINQYIEGIYVSVGQSHAENTITKKNNNKTPLENLFHLNLSITSMQNTTNCMKKLECNI